MDSQIEIKKTPSLFTDTMEVYFVKVGEMMDRLEIRRSLLTTEQQTKYDDLVTLVNTLQGMYQQGCIYWDHTPSVNGKQMYIDIHDENVDDTNTTYLATDYSTLNPTDQGRYDNFKSLVEELLI